MKKLLETSLGRWSETVFTRDGTVLDFPTGVVNILNSECSPYVTKDNGGVLVYMSNEEYKEIQEKPK